MRLALENFQVYNTGCRQLLEILEIYWNFKISWKSWKSTGIL